MRTDCQSIIKDGKYKMSCHDMILIRIDNVLNQCGELNLCDSLLNFEI